MINKIFYSFIISFLISIFFSSLNYNFFYEILFLATTTIFISFIYLIHKKYIPFFIKILIIISLAFLLGTFRYDFFEKNNKGEFDNLLHQKITQQFIINDIPEKKGYHTKLILKFKDANSQAISWVPNYPTYNYGDLIEIEGYLLKPKNFKNELGREFDYISYLKKEKIFYEIKTPNITFIESNHGNQIKEKLFNIKKIFLNKIKEQIPPPQSFLLGGILLGAKEDVGKELLDEFRKTGIIHIVVLSGYNLTLVADFFMKLFAFTGFTLSSIFGSMAIIFFAIMVGASATIIRASIMALLVIIAKITGRDSEIIKILFLTGFIMVLFNPMILVYDASFQLSFLATLGLLTLGKKMESYLKIIPKTFELRGILAATISTQIFVAPLLIYMMGEISIISPLVNILILILIPCTMFLGLLLILFSFISTTFSSLLAFLLFIILSYDLFITGFFAKIPISVLQLNFKFWEIIFIYLSFIIIFFFYKKSQK